MELYRLELGTSLGSELGTGNAELDVETVRRQVAHDLYGKLAFCTFAIWTLGTLLLFILFAAGNPRPIPMAAMSMTVPILPAALPWVLYRPLTTWITSRRLRRRESRG